VITWAVVDATRGDTTDEHGRHIVPAASTIKLFIYSAFQRSQLDPDETASATATGGSGVAEYLSSPLPLAGHAFLMLAVSDNASTNVLLDRLGFDAVNAEIERLGLENTRVRRRMMAAGPENETTAIDLATGLARLLDEPFADEMLQALQVSADLSSFIPHLLPAATVAAKWGNTELVRHEVAYVTEGDKRLVTAVCSSPPETPDVLARVAAERARLAAFAANPGIASSTSASTSRVK
jgi:beta-lactamase class A